MPETAGESELLALLKKLNADSRLHGILVQAPLPKQIREAIIYSAVLPQKDVDGFHPVNVGKLMLGDPTGFQPCTPAGIRELLVRSKVKTDGAEVVILGRGNIVGKPMAALLCQKAKGANATVTICHSGTRDIRAHCRRADILIAAMGVAEFVKADMVKPGATVIDVGVNRVNGKARRRRGVRGSSAGGRQNHAQSRRGRPDDHCHVDAKHRARGGKLFCSGESVTAGFNRITNSGVHRAPLQQNKNMNPTRILPDLQASLLCEEVRQEANGNFFIIGVVNFLRVPQLPIVAGRLCVFNRWTAGIGQFTESVRLIAPDQTTVLRKGEMKFELREPGSHSTNVMVFNQVEFKTAGTYFVEVLVDDVMKLRYPVPLIHAPPPNQNPPPPAEKR